MSRPIPITQQTADLLRYEKVAMNERALAPSVSATANPALSTPQPQAVVSRRPIYDLQRDLYAYRLQCHSQAVRQPLEDASDEDVTHHHTDTPELICNTFMETGLDTIVGPHYAVFQLTRGLILMDYALVLPSDRVILEVADFTPSDAELAEAIVELAEQGYRFALKPSVADETSHTLLETAAFLRIDLQTYTQAELPEQVKQWQTSNAKLFAENVDSSEAFAYCQKLGFDYVQGDFLGQVETLTHRRSPTNRAALLNLMTQLIDPRTQRHDLAALIGQDVACSYKVLRLLHNTATDTQPTVTSISEAIQALGMKTLIEWTSLMLIAGLDDPPHEALTTGVIRARMCQLLATARGMECTKPFFLAGLLSSLTDLLEMPQAELLPQLPIRDDLRQALHLYDGEVGRILYSVLAFERGDWDDIHERGIDSSTITDSYLQALVWAEAI